MEKNNNQSIVFDKPIIIPGSKRLFDVVASIFLALLLLPLFTIIFFGLLIEHSLRGNIPMPFYREKRISRGRPFNFIKFNIFKPNIIRGKKRTGEFIHTKEMEKHDGNVTFVGSLILKVYLDEMPQIFNVIRGDMSMVGPRPVNLEIYKRDLDRGNKTRALVKTGLTGFYQAHKGEPGFNQYQLDSGYIEYLAAHNGWQIIWLDLKIIIRTPLIMLKAKGY